MSESNEGMLLFRYGLPGCERPAVRVGRTDYDLTALTPDIDGSFLGSDGVDRVRRALVRGDLSETVTTGERLGPPIARPAAIICVGQNYAEHAAESGAEPPDVPVVFLKHPGCVIGPHDAVRIPRNSVHTDWEVELAVVLKRTPRYLDDRDDPLDYVAGYTISNDVSERRFQIDLSGGQWSKGKSAETFNPLGPFLVPADHLEPQNLDLRSWVNGERRQDSSTKDMVFAVAEIIRHLSHHMLLLPGDVINTGTPAGVALSGRYPYLQVDDIVELEITGLGRQRQVMVPA